MLAHSIKGNENRNCDHEITKNKFKPQKYDALIIPSQTDLHLSRSANMFQTFNYNVTVELNTAQIRLKFE